MPFYYACVKGYKEETFGKYSKFITEKLQCVMMVTWSESEEQKLSKT